MIKKILLHILFLIIGFLSIAAASTMPSNDLNISNSTAIQDVETSQFSKSFTIDKNYELSLSDDSNTLTPFTMYEKYILEIDNTEDFLSINSNPLTSFFTSNNEYVLTTVFMSEMYVKNLTPYVSIAFYETDLTLLNESLDYSPIFIKAEGNSYTISEDNLVLFLSSTTNETNNLTLYNSNAELYTSSSLTGSLSYSQSSIINIKPIEFEAINYTINEDTSQLSIPFTINEAYELTILNSISSSSSNTKILKNNSETLQIVGNDKNGNLIIIPEKDQFGETIVSLSISYSNTITLLENIYLTVLPVNDRPTLDKIDDVTIYEDTNRSINLVSISSGPSNENQNLTVTAICSNLDIISISEIDYSPLNGSAIFDIYANQNAYGGPTLITVTINDGQVENNITEKMFKVFVEPVNDQPIFDPGPNQVVHAGSDIQIITNWASNISAGPKEFNQNLTFNISTNDSSLFELVPKILADGTLLYKPSQSNYGIAYVQVILCDDGGIENNGNNCNISKEFQINVKPKIPDFELGSDIIVFEDSGFQMITNFVNNINVDKNIEFITEIFNDLLFSDIPKISSDGSLSFKTAPDLFGMAVIKVKLKSNEIESQTKEFSIIIKKVNDQPSFISKEKLMCMENSDIISEEWASNIKTGPSNELGQSYSFKIIDIDNFNLFSVIPKISSEGILTYQPAPNVFGTVNMQIVLIDDAGVDNGGKDTSEVHDLKIFIMGINNCPEFTIGEDQWVKNRDGYQEVKDWALDINPGINESNQEVKFILEVENKHLFEELPQVNSDGILTYTPSPYTFGTSKILIYAEDNGGQQYEDCNKSQIKDFKIYIEPTMFTLKILTNGNGNVTINEEQVIIGEEYLFYPGEEINVIASAIEKWDFTYWSGDIVNSENIINITMDDNKTIIANFVEKMVSLDLNGDGQISINNVFYDLPWTGNFLKEEEIELEVIPSGKFMKWTGDYEGEANPVMITMDRDKQIDVHYYPSDIWRLTLFANSKDDNNLDTDVQKESKVKIGVMPEEKLFEAIKTNSVFSCDMFIYSNSWEKYSTYYKENGKMEYNWIIAINPHGNVGDPKADATVVLSWDTLNFCENGLYQLKKGTGTESEIVISDMRKITQCEISGNNEYQIYTLSWSAQGFLFKIDKGWNLISLPVNPITSQLSEIFPDAEVAYEFKNGGYNFVKELLPGVGYWIKNSISGEYLLKGRPYKEYSINLTPGWHLIGSVNDIKAPETTPDDNVEVIYKYEKGSYFRISQIEPGKGCWVNILENCELILK